MRRLVYRIARVPAALAALVLAASTAGAQTRQLEVTLPSTDARARVQRAFADVEMPITGAQGEVIEGRRTDRLLTIRYLASLIPVDSATTRVVLTAFGTRPQFGSMPQAEAQLTDKTGGLGKKAWSDLVRLRDAIAAEPVRKDSGAGPRP